VALIRREAEGFNSVSD